MPCRGKIVPHLGKHFFYVDCNSFIKLPGPNLTILEKGKTLLTSLSTPEQRKMNMQHNELLAGT